jgi:hypothetical protein
MSKLTGRKSKKDIFYPETGLDPKVKDGYVMGGDYIKKSTGEKITGESTGKIKVDKKGIKYVEDLDNPSDTTHLKNIGPIQQKYSSMKSMGQAVAKWTSPLAQKKHTKEQRDQLSSQKKYPVKGAADIQVEGRYVASPDLINEGNDPGKIPFKPTKSISEFSKDHGSGKRDAQGNFQYITTYDSSNFPTKKKNPNYLSKPQPGSDPRAAANTKLGIEKPIPKYIKRPEEEPKKKTKAPAKPKFEPLEKVEKRGGEGFEGFTRTNLMGPSQPGDSQQQVNIVSKEEEAKDRERKDMARMQRAVDSANDSEKLMAGLNRKEKRKMARYDRTKAEKAVKATEAVQTIGSFLADLKPGGTKVEKAGVAAEQPKKDKDKDKDKDKPGNDGTQGLTDLGKTLITLGGKT